MASKALREALARERELQAVVAANEASRKAANEAIKPAVKRLTTLRAQQAKQLALTQAGGQPNSNEGGIALTSVGTISLAWGAGAPKDPKKLAASLVAGETKIQARGGVAYTLRGFLARTRLTDVARLRKVKAAERARRRAQDALVRAWKAEREAYIEAFDAGDKPDLQAIAAMIAKRLAINPVPIYDNELSMSARNAELALDRVHAHIAFLRSGSTEVCPCPDCANDRAEAIKLRDLRVRLATMKRRGVNCPTHGKRRGYIDPERRERLYLNEQWLYGVPIVWCPGKAKADTPHQLVDSAQMKRDEEAKAKAEAKAALHAKYVEFTCPNPDCEEDVVAQVVRGYDEHWLQGKGYVRTERDEVVCGVCEAPWALSAVKVIRKVPAKEAVAA